MPKNIREKLALILEDAESLKRHDLLRLLERMFNEELEFLQLEHKIDSYDLNSVRSRAISLYNELSMTKESLGYAHGDGELIRTMCFVMATLELFRGKGLIAFTVKYNKK